MPAWSEVMASDERLSLTSVPLAKNNITVLQQSSKLDFASSLAERRGRFTGSSAHRSRSRLTHHHVPGSNPRFLHPRPPPLAERETCLGMHPDARDLPLSGRLSGIRSEYTSTNSRSDRRGGQSDSSELHRSTVSKLEHTMF